MQAYWSFHQALGWFGLGALEDEDIRAIGRWRIDDLVNPTVCLVHFGIMEREEQETWKANMMSDLSGVP